MEELDFKLYFILINLNLNSHLCLVATALESAFLGLRDAESTNLLL